MTNEEQLPMRIDGKKTFARVFLIMMLIVVLPINILLTFFIPLLGVFGLVLSALLIAGCVFYLVFIRTFIVIDKQGLTINPGVGSLQMYRWGDVKDFRPITVKGAKWVGFDYTEQFNGEKQKFRQTIPSANIDAAIAFSTRLRSDELAELLNRVRDTILA